ncbi:hypothetical protein FA95DRAFT_1539420 [Auriscalpium vulgare]|uniref:Uncharacterized protein n=1 Tax=Auriscalpium vulgare TaxID=40419 RepID=A0ACB8RXW9_9AGAM|nr:hypothetical protein FA95DRAFT_1539420 [Auriscalpium vulgare]
MDDSRSQTLEVLEKFILSQRALLSRTASDVSRLQKLREQAVETPESVLETLGTEDPPLRLTGELDVVSEVQHDIDWTLLKGADPTPLRTLTADLHLAHQARAHPAPTQRAPLSPLQLLVRDARRTLLDPVLPALVPSPDSSDGEAAPTPEERRKERERAKIRELRRRRFGEGGLTLPHARADGVYVRRDLADESALVDISLDDDLGAGAEVEAETEVETGGGKSSASQEPEVPAQSAAASPVSAAPSRSRRTAPKAQPVAVPQKAKPVAPPKTKRPSSPTPEPDAAPPPGKRAKPRPDTYKQAWSVSEQHLLERLMGEIPDGEKNRWAKISRAMGGHRTPRQVASRVQKYFEKLKKFGVDITAGRAGQTNTVDRDAAAYNTP